MFWHCESNSIHSTPKWCKMRGASGLDTVFVVLLPLPTTLRQLIRRFTTYVLWARMCNFNCPGLVSIQALVLMTIGTILRRIMSPKLPAIASTNNRSRFLMRFATLASRALVIWVIRKCGAIAFAHCIEVRTIFVQIKFMCVHWSNPCLHCVCSLLASLQELRGTETGNEKLYLFNGLVPGVARDRMTYRELLEWSRTLRNKKISQVCARTPQPVSFKQVFAIFFAIPSSCGCFKCYRTLWKWLSACLLKNSPQTFQSILNVLFASNPVVVVYIFCTQLRTN